MCSGNSQPQLALRFEHLSYCYHKSDGAIGDFSGEIAAGKLIGLLGANGSGKSTLLKMLSGILLPKSGQIEVWGNTIKGYSAKELSQVVSYFPQYIDQTLPFTVEEILEMGVQQGKYDFDLVLRRVGLEHKRKRAICELSGGEIRRAFLAMFLIKGTKILLLDEPLSNLDIKYQIELLKILKQLQLSVGLTIVMAIHDLNILGAMDGVMLLKHGQVLSDSAITEKNLQEIYHTDNAFIITRDEMGECWIKPKIRD
ncbi:MAG: ABC transporter ATP-binding protein [Oligoflexia bacterium]|nr:ABC transporter ATP-binding protein [Oligoflexia bacterium]MBF0364503.1 ABC transporter ATP-binding protein [Oligoflexia bacterium]